MSKKIFWMDCETTGTNPLVHGMIQLSCMIEIDGTIVEERDFLMKPVGAEYDPRALEVNGITAEEIDTRTPDTVVYRDIIRLLDTYINKYEKKDKFAIGGYNVDFDIGFLTALFQKCGNSYFRSYFSAGTLDLMKVLHFLEYAGRIDLTTLPNFKLATVAEMFGVSLENAHDGMADIRATRETTLKVVTFLEARDLSKEVANLRAVIVDEAEYLFCLGLNEPAEKLLSRIPERKP